MLYRLWLMSLVTFYPIAYWSTTAYFVFGFILLPLSFFSLAFYLQQQRAPEKFSHNFRNLVLAHRGGQAKQGSPEPIFPENSLAAFRWCSDPLRCGGADGFELDVWLSKDGVPMVNHDPAVFRHFDGEGFINEMAVAELKALRFLPEPHFPPQLNSVDNAYEKQEIKQKRTVIDPKFIQTERMPSLQEVIDFLSKEAPHMKLMIEVKERKNVQAMCRALHKMYEQNTWMYERTFVASFNPFILYHLRKLNANIVTSFLFIDNWTFHLLKNARDMKIAIPWWLEYNYPLRWMIDDLVWAMGRTPLGLSVLGANLSACEVKALTEGQIREDRKAGIITSCWVANNERQKEFLLEQGVTVITDVQFSGGTSMGSPRPQIQW